VRVQKSRFSINGLLNCSKLSPLTSVIFFQAISEAFKMATDPDLEWTATILDVKPQVILHDRLMTDAALGTVPIKSEHSYSLTSDGDSIPDSPLSLDNKMDGKCDFSELAREQSTAHQ
jgi:cyclic AMP-responsive element-binding protein 3